MSIRDCATALVLAWAFVPATAHSQDGDRYGGIGIGWSAPMGQVRSMTDLVQFSAPVPAAELYKPGLAVHLGGGRRFRGWLVELSIDARIPRLTPAGQAIVDQTHPDSGEVDVEYASFEAVVGRAVGSQRLSLFGAVGLGLAIMQFSSGSSVAPHNDTGVGGSAKIGVDWSPARPQWLAIRLAGRYQLFTAGVDLPHDATIHLMTLVRF